MLNMKKIIGASIFAVVAAMPVRAEMVLDTFSYVDGGGAAMDYAGNDYFTIVGDTPSTFVGFSAAGAATFYALDAVEVGPNNADLNNFAGVLSYNNATGVSSETLISYFGSPAGIDFTSFGEYFYFDVISSDGGFDITIDVQDSSSNIVSSTFSVLSAVANETLILSFASFTGDLGFDWTSVSNVFASLSTGANTAIDLSLDEVGIVPEPSAIALLGLGLLGLGFRARKQSV